jgi:hypothetical protein
LKTGIILEMDEHFLTLLTPEGQFLRARNEEYLYQVGQEIQFVPIEDEVRKPVSWFASIKGKALTAAALVLLIGGSILVPVYQNNQVYAYMSIDDGSSIELELNKQLQVIGMKPYNKEGEEIVNTISEWKKQDLSTVSVKILAEMQKKHVGDGEIVLSSTIISDPDNESEQLLAEQISTINTSANQKETTITVISGTQDEREKAKEQGITLGQFKEKNKAKKDKIKKDKKSKNNQTASENSEENQTAPNPSDIPSENPNPPAQQNIQQPNNEVENKGNGNVDQKQFKKQEQAIKKQEKQQWQAEKRQEKDERKHSDNRR